MAPFGILQATRGRSSVKSHKGKQNRRNQVALSGNVNFGGQSLGPEENGIGGFVIPTTDESGLQLSIGDTVVFPNPTPGQNGLANTPDLVGVVIAFGGSLFTANVPSVTQISTAIAVYNIPCSKARQIYSAIPGNMENGPVQG